MSTTGAYWLSFIALFLLSGAAGTGLIARRAGLHVPESRRIAIAGGVLAILAAAARLLAQSNTILDPGESLTGETLRLALATSWGRGWWWQACCAVLALASAVAPPVPALLGATSVALSLPLTGHAVESPAGSVAGVLVHGIHAMAGSLWLGTLGVIVIAWWLARRRREPDGAQGLARLINSFSPLALGCAALVAVSGVGAALPLVGTFPALVGSDYGRLLLLKLGLLAGVLAVGAWNWRVVRPALGTDVSTARLLRSATVELMLAVLILGVTAVLVGTAPPS